MWILCEMKAIRENDGLTAAVKIKRLSEIIEICAASLMALSDLTNAAHNLGITLVPFHNHVFDDCLSLVSDQAIRDTDKVLDADVPPLHPDVLAKFRKGY